jgi:hypothetical protein
MNSSHPRRSLESAARHHKQLVSMVRTASGSPAVEPLTGGG